MSKGGVYWESPKQNEVMCPLELSWNFHPPIRVEGEKIPEGINSGWIPWHLNAKQKVLFVTRIIWLLVGLKKNTPKKTTWRDLGHWPAVHDTSDFRMHP